MRQVGQKEFEFVMLLAVRKLPISVLKGLVSNVTDTRDKAQRMAAHHLVVGLSRYEVLIDAPAPHGEDGKLTPNGRA